MNNYEEVTSWSLLGVTGLSTQKLLSIFLVTIQNCMSKII